MPLQAVRTSAGRYRGASRRPTPEQWRLMMPELLYLKRLHGNAKVVQALLDEGYDTSSSTVDRRFSEWNTRRPQPIGDIEHSLIVVDDILNQPTVTLSLTSEPGDDQQPFSPLQGSATSHFESFEVIQSDTKNTVTHESKTIHDGQTGEPLPFSISDAMSTISLDDSAVLLRSECSQSLPDSSDITIETESNCPSMFATMDRTRKRARKSMEKLKKDALKPRLPPSAPSPGQKVEDWHDNPRLYFLAGSQFSQSSL